MQKSASRKPIKGQIKKEYRTNASEESFKKMLLNNQNIIVKQV